MNIQQTIRVKHLLLKIQDEEKINKNNRKVKNRKKRTYIWNKNITYKTKNSDIF